MIQTNNGHTSNYPKLSALLGAISQPQGDVKLAKVYAVKHAENLNGVHNENVNWKPASELVDQDLNLQQQAYALAFHGYTYVRLEITPELKGAYMLNVQLSTLK